MSVAAFTSPTKLVNELIEASDDKQLGKTIARYGRPSPTTDRTAQGVKDETVASPFTGPLVEAVVSDVRQIGSRERHPHGGRIQPLNPADSDIEHANRLTINDFLFGEAGRPT